MTARSATDRLTLALLVLVSAAGLTGCEAAGFVAHVIAGPRKTPAVYEPVDRPTAVFIDDPAGRLPSRELGNLLAARIGEDLAEHEVIEQIIPSIMVERLKAANTDFNKWPIDKVGREVGARQVLYVLVQDCQIVEKDLIYRPTLTVRIKIIDVETGTRMFPDPASVIGADGQPVQHATTYRDMEGATAASRIVLMRELMESAAVDIAQLFYKHAEPELGSRLPG